MRAHKTVGGIMMLGPWDSSYMRSNVSYKQLIIVNVGKLTSDGVK